MSTNHHKRLSKGNGRPQCGDALAPQGAGANGEARGELMATTPSKGENGEKMVEVSTASPEPARRGRPTVMDEEVKRQVCLLLSVGLSRRQAAAYVDIVHTTIANAIERDEEFAARVERAEQMSVIKPLLTIATASRKNWHAAAWLAERNERRLKPTKEESRQSAREMAESLRELSDAIELSKKQPDA
jgi:hypothetical protein